MAIRVVQLGAPRAPGEGLRLGGYLEPFDPRSLEDLFDDRSADSISAFRITAVHPSDYEGQITVTFLAGQSCAEARSEPIPATAMAASSSAAPKSMRCRPL